MPPGATVALSGVIRKRAGRTELAAKERAEMELLKTYLPAELSDEELARRTSRRRERELDARGQGELFFNIRRALQGAQRKG